MSKYDPLSKHLAGRAGPEWRASFAELEKLLGAPLPKAAHGGRAWWQAEGPQARAWKEAGWSADDVDPAAGRVTFRRNGAAPEPTPEPPDAPPILERLEATPKWQLALVAGGLAIAAGLGVFAIRGALRKKDG